ncbi:MAG: hypothetical protein ACYC5G_02100 [Candidatus Doudnabacteria bacterium]
MRVQRATAATGAISLTINPGIDFRLIAIKVHLSAVGGAGNLTVTTDANAGATYDAILALQDMTSVADYVYVPTNPVPFVAGDKVVIAWANSGNNTYGIEAFWTADNLG